MAQNSSPPVTNTKWCYRYSEFPNKKTSTEKWSEDYGEMSEDAYYGVLPEQYEPPVWVIDDEVIKLMSGVDRQ